MTRANKTINLGFAKQQFCAGSHICQIFSNDDERQDILLKFLLSGLQSGERNACFSEFLVATALEEFLDNYGISYDEVYASGALTLSGTRSIYFQGGRFDPDRMLALVRNFYQDSMNGGFSAARIIGEMTPEVEHLPGGERLLEYESKISLFLEEHPVTAVCQYGARIFSGATIMDVLKVHPLMMVRGAVVRNPFFIAPEEFLSHCKH